MQHLTINATFKNAIWDLLVRDGVAKESERQDFLPNWPQSPEHRFQGKFGFGGKIRYEPGTLKGSPIYVTAYGEDIREDFVSKDALHAINVELERTLKYYTATKA